MKKKLIKICSVIMALSLMMLTFAACGDKDYEPDDGSTPSTEDNSQPEETPNEELPQGVNPLTGKKDLSDSASGARPIAIMVENSPQARPQWGLSSPDIVLEGVVEGGITRMMWIYADAAKIPKIGPVRSARHDYVEIAAGMNAIYGHWGGSPQAYSAIKNFGMKDVDGSVYGNKYFFKDPARTGRGTEHAGWTNGEHLASAIETAGIDKKAKNTSWTMFTPLTDGERAFADGASSCNSITVTFSSSYKHTFKYNAGEKLYYNYMNSAEMKDGNNNKTMAVANVIVMYCPVNPIKGDDSGRQDWELGSGKGLLVSGGKCENITWKKTSKTAPLKFYGADGKELSVNKGQSWVGVVPTANESKTVIA